ncbi:hypothetical protein F2Q69_00059603 [Brassica cretica]|uniref:Uncharacterized protein n=1 Tax=Brassica cretica TaxID=69181 RepID=A0A8S9RDD1_BRACR|nr:hypothetical protein F2Q69_00059603 [Brassica cretica]
MDHGTKQAVQLVRSDHLRLAFQSHRSEVNQHPVVEVMLVLLKGGKSTLSSSVDGRAGPVQFGRWPSWIDHATRSAILRAGQVQFGGWPIWIDDTTSSAIRRAGPVQFELGGWPSWNGHAVLVPSVKLCPRNSIKLALV